MPYRNIFTKQKWKFKRNSLYLPHIAKQRWQKGSKKYLTEV